MIQFGVPYFRAILALTMYVSLEEAKKRLPELIRAVEAGEEVVITRDGKAVAQLARPPANGRGVQWGSMHGRIKLLPGWDDGVHLERFLAGDL